MLFSLLIILLKNYKHKILKLMILRGNFAELLGISSRECHLTVLIETVSTKLPKKLLYHIFGHIMQTAAFIFNLFCIRSFLVKLKIEEIIFTLFMLKLNICIKIKCISY